MVAGASSAGPLLSVVVVTWNSERVIGECIASLQEAATGIDWELTVVDNASSDGTRSVVRAMAPAARIIANGRNLGLAAANNQGIDASGGSTLLVCNPDVRFAPGAIRAMLDVLERHPRAGWVIPRLLYEDGSLQTSVGDLPTLAEAVLGRQHARRSSRGEPHGFWWDGWHHLDERRVGRGHEAAYLLRRSAVEAVGQQDERYVLDWEGNDWADRFQRHGWEIWLAPEALVVHLGGSSIRTVPYRWIASQHRGMYVYYSERRPRRDRPALAVVFSVRAALKMLAVTARLPMYQLAHRGRRASEQHGPPAQRGAGQDGESEGVGGEGQREAAGGLAG